MVFFISTTCWPACSVSIHMKPGRTRCRVGRRYTRAYLRHLCASGEPLALTLNSVHNLAFYLDTMDRARRELAGVSAGGKYLVVGRSRSRRRPVPRRGVGVVLYVSGMSSSPRIREFALPICSRGNAEVQRSRKAGKWQSRVNWHFSMRDKSPMHSSSNDDHI